MAGKKGGRPEKVITPEMLVDVKKWASYGATNEQIADKLGMARSTFQEKLLKLPDLSDALKKGKSSGIIFVANRLMQAVEAGNITAMIFFLKCQANWKENDPNLVAVQPLIIKADGKVIEMS